MMEVAPTRAIAKTKGLKHYHGKACKKHGTTIRVVNRCTCYLCNKHDIFRHQRDFRQRAKLAKAKQLDTLWLIPSNSEVGRP